MSFQWLERARVQRLLAAPRARVAIVGASGLGKSSLLRAVVAAHSSGAGELVAIDDVHAFDELVALDARARDRRVLVVSDGLSLPVGFQAVVLRPFSTERAPATRSPAASFFEEAVLAENAAFRRHAADAEIFEEIAAALDGHRAALVHLAGVAARDGVTAALLMLRGRDAASSLEQELVARTARDVRLFDGEDDVFAALAEMGGPFDLAAAVACTTRSVAEAATLLDRLVERSLVLEDGPSRYRLARFLRLSPSPEGRAKVAERMAVQILDRYRATDVEAALDADFAGVTQRLRAEAPAMVYALRFSPRPETAIACGVVLARVGSHAGLEDSSALLWDALRRESPERSTELRVEALKELAHAFRRRHKVAEGRRVVEELRKLSDASPSARTFALMSEAYLDADLDPRAGEEKVHAFFESEGANLSARETTRGYLMRAYLLWMNGRTELASSDLDEGIRMAEDGGFTFLKINLLDLAVYLECVRGQMARARKFGEEATRLLSTCPSLALRAYVTSTRGYFLAVDERVEDAASALSEALALSIDVGARLLEEDCVANLAVIHLAAGDLPRARALAPTVFRVLATPGHRFEGVARAFLAAVDVLEHDGASVALAPDPSESDPFARIVLALVSLTSRARAVDAGRADAEGLREHLHTCDAPLAPGADKRYVVFRAFVRALLRPSLRRLGLALAEEADVAPTLTVGDEESWFAVDGGLRVDLVRRAPLRRMFRALLAEYEARPGNALHRDALIDIAWPGEAVQARAARNRVHVALTTLRRLGLEKGIQSTPEGYLLRTGTTVVRSSEPA